MKKRKSPCVDILTFQGRMGAFGLWSHQSRMSEMEKMKPYETKLLENELIKRMSHLREIK